MYTEQLKKNIRKNLLRPSVRNKSIDTLDPRLYRTKTILDNQVHILDEVHRVLPEEFSDSKLDEKLYVILNDVYHKPRCNCGNIVKFKRFNIGYNTFCSKKCSASDSGYQKRKNATMLEKFGVEHHAQLPERREFYSKNLKELIAAGKIDYAQGQKTRERLYSTNTGWSPSAIETRISNGTMVPPELRAELQEYRRHVKNVTKRQNIDELENSEKRGTIGHKEDPYHIDHVFSVYDGFMLGIEPEVIGNISNLRFLPALENIKKRNQSDKTLEELFEDYEKQRIRPTSN